MNNKNRCIAITLNGERCKNRSKKESYCSTHEKLGKYRRFEGQEMDDRLLKILAAGTALIQLMKDAEAHIPDLIYFAMGLVDNSPMYNHQEDQAPPQSVPTLKKLRLTRRFIHEVLSGKDLDQDFEGAALLGYWESNELFPLNLEKEYKDLLPQDLYQNLQQAITDWRELYRRQDGSFPLQPVNELNEI